MVLLAAGAIERTEPWMGMTMAILQRYTSPDGALTLLVDFTDGDWSVGFDRFAWHTHGDILASLYGGTPEEAVAIFVEDILASRRVIVISRVDGEVRDAWVADDPDADESKYASENETIEKRLWSGYFDSLASSRAD